MSVRLCEKLFALFLFLSASTAAELARYLQRISGAEFTVETGDGSRGGALGKPNGRFTNL